MSNGFSAFGLHKVTDIVKTLCPYCGVGCGLEVLNNQDQARSTSTNSSSNWKVRGDRTHPSSQGMVCVKGATVAEALDKDRLLYPMVRDSLSEPFRRASWEEALNIIVKQIQRVCRDFTTDALCMYGSGQMQTEDYYIAQKLLKGCLGTNNFDSNSRLCMSSAVKGYLQSFGSDGPPCCYEDLELTDCAFIIGSNAAECHPIAFNRFIKHKKKNRQVKLIVVDPRRTPTADAADLHLAIRPGTDIDLLNGMAYLLLSWGEIDAEFIDECTNNFASYAETLQYYPPTVVAERCGISVTELKLAASYWAESRHVLSLWSMGINQSREGTAKVSSIINLHLLSGQIGKPGSGPFSLTGQPNAMGGREAGGLSNLLPGYRLVNNPQHRAEVEDFWQIPKGKISPKAGLSAWEIITGLEQGEVQFLWVVATNPAVSLPDLERTKAALKNSPFTICQDAYYPTETADYAHVLLPAAQWGEKTGTMTNSERVITLCSAVRQPVGEAKPDWEIFAEVARCLGFASKFPFTSSSEVHAEFVQLTRGQLCDMTGVSHENLKNKPIQWPFADPQTRTDSVNTVDNYCKRLYSDYRFLTHNGRANFVPKHSRGLAEPPNSDYPFVLTTGRVYGHWHTQTRTGRIEKIQKMYPDPFIEIHPRDAANLGIADKSWVLVRSSRGQARFLAKVTSSISPGTVFVPIHWGALWAEDSEANALTHHEACPDSLQPELKACAVQLIATSVEFTKNNSQFQPSECHSNSI
jgi:ferredoxin-nitrate reductase